eukprot:scaffold96615_cov27-Tisochrysis_lutea.AAC.1
MPTFGPAESVGASIGFSKYGPHGLHVAEAETWTREVGPGEGPGAQDGELRAVLHQAAVGRARVGVDEARLPDGAAALACFHARTVVQPQVVAQLVREGGVETVGRQVERKARDANPPAARPADVGALGHDDAAEVEVGARDASLREQLREGPRVHPRIGGRPARPTDVLDVATRTREVARDADRVGHRRHQPELATRVLGEEGGGLVDHRAQVARDAPSVSGADEAGVKGGVALAGGEVAGANGKQKNRLGSRRVPAGDARRSAARGGVIVVTLRLPRVDVLVPREDEAAVEGEAAHSDVARRHERPRVLAQHLVLVGRALRVVEQPGAEEVVREEEQAECRERRGVPAEGGAERRRLREPAALDERAQIRQPRVAPFSRVLRRHERQQMHQDQHGG